MGIPSQFFGGPLDGKLKSVEDPSKRCIIEQVEQAPDGMVILAYYTYIPVYHDNVCGIFYLHDVQCAPVNAKRQ
jgi:hypothetical protein